MMQQLNNLGRVVLTLSAFLVSPVVAKALLWARGPQTGLGSRVKGPLHFSRLPHRPQQRPCLNGNQWDNPSTQGSERDANGLTAQSDETYEAVLQSHMYWESYMEGPLGGREKTFEGWNHRVGPQGDIPLSACQNRPIFFFPETSRHLTPITFL